MSRFESPTIDLLVVFVAVFLLQSIGGVVGLGTATFALASPTTRPWTLVTSVYAHAGLGHLVANAVALALVGFPLERFTTRTRFHLFVLLTGTVAGVTQLVVAGLVDRPTAVLGASGAILALYGYVLAGNPLTGGLLARLSPGPRAKLALLVGAALVVTLLTAGPGVALVAHGVGFALGLVAGRAGLILDYSDSG